MHSRSLLLLLLLLAAATILLSAPDPAAQARGDAGDPAGEPVTLSRDPDEPGLFDRLRAGWAPPMLEPVATPPLFEPGEAAAPLDHGADFCSSAPSLRPRR